MTSSTERRSSIRRPIHHDASLTVTDEFTTSCIVADYCQEGMFLKLDTSRFGFAQLKESQVPLTLSFKSQHGIEYQVDATLVHEMSGAIGVKFIGQFPSAINALNDMNQSAPAVTKRDSDHIVEECILSIQSYTTPLVSDFLDKLVEELRNISVKAASDQLANTIMASSERVEKQKREIQASFSLGIQDPIGVYQKHIESSEKMNDTLSIVDKGEFEDWLVSRVLITKAETSFRSELLPLKVRLDAIGVGNKSYHQSVFGPALVVNSFHAAISQLEMDVQSEKEVMKLFDSEVLSKLEALYRSLNAILVKHKIMPDLDLAKAVKSQVKSRKPFSPKSTPQAATTQAQTDSLEEKAGYGADSRTGSIGSRPTIGGKSLENTISSLGGGSGVADAQSATFTQAPFTPAESGRLSESFSQHQSEAQSALDNVVGLMRSLRSKTHEQDASELGQGQSHTSGESTDGAAIELVSEQEVTDGLAQLQAESVSLSLDEHVPLMSRIQDNLELADSGKQLEDDQKVAIDVVDRFFYSMRNNPRLSSEAKQHLLRLEVPVLKVLLKDERFFNDHSSSVRAVMNRIAQLGAKGAALNPASKRKVSELVEKIVDQFEQDTAIFDYVLAELDALVARQNNIYVKNVERVAAAAEGTHKVEEANVAVSRELNNRFRDKKVPAAVSVLVDQGWKDLLTQTHIKYGEESEEWQSYLAVLDRLIAYGENPDIPVDTKRILPMIQEGLKQVSATNEAPGTVREALKNLIVNAPRNTHSMIEAQLYEGPETEDQLVQRNLSKSQELKPWIVKAKSAELGAWYSWEREGKDTQYIRLVWIAKGYSKFVFVNHQGMKVIEMGLLKLAEHLKQRSITPDLDYEQPMVNQSLDNMVKDVYDKLAYESSHDQGSGLIKRSEFCRQVKSQMRVGKRTSKCVLVYIRFAIDAEGEKVLDPELAKDIASTLDDQISDSTIGRINETDFVIFVVLNDRKIGLDQLQPALEKLYLNEGGISNVMVGESHAHLGFNNPESMIEHARDCIGIEREVQDTESDSQGIEGDSQDIENAIQKVAEVDEEYQADHGNSEGVLVETPVANDDELVPGFEDLSLVMMGQRTQRVSDENAVEDSDKESSHINLVCFDEEAGVAYEPVSDADMQALDQWWIKQIEQLESDGHPVLSDYEYVRVKLSAYALSDEDFCSTLEAMSEIEAIPAQKICFDIYEGAVIEDLHLVLERMRKLIDLGYRFCLDHFGSERSPFAFLKALPFFMINIDESFVKSLSEEGDNEIAADSIAEIAHYLGKKVLATSVDSAICAQKMKKLKVDYIQGSTVSPYEKI